MKRRTGGAPDIRLEVVEPGHGVRRGRDTLERDRDFRFSTEGLRSYAFARWEEVVFDAVVLGIAVEYADATVKRPPHSWARHLCVSVPVHDLARWNDGAVVETLHGVLGFLTGDRWEISFVRLPSRRTARYENFLSLSVPAEACMPFSDGLDSRAASGILYKTLGKALILVRVQASSGVRSSRNEPFVRVPYTIRFGGKRQEPTGRTRGFRFALLSGIAAYLTQAQAVVLPESGQGAIGVALVTVANSYPDYRGHPFFARRMEGFLRALLGRAARYEFPFLWNTKGETLQQFVRVTSDESWPATRSCWRDSRWSSVARSRRQCGVCAACMLRRVAVHAAGLEEPKGTYVCIDMTADCLEKAVDPRFSRLNRAFREYAIAGVLHMEHLAEMASGEKIATLRRHASLLGPALDLTLPEAASRLRRLFGRHRDEWATFLDSLGRRSFVRSWTAKG